MRSDASLCVREMQMSPTASWWVERLYLVKVREGEQEDQPWPDTKKGCSRLVESLADPLLPTLKLSRIRPDSWTGSSLATVACSSERPVHSLADSMKSSASRSSTFFITPLASCIMLPALKYGGRTGTGEEMEEGEEVVEETVIPLSLVTRGLTYEEFGWAGCRPEFKTPGICKTSSEYFLLGLEGCIGLLVVAL